MDVSWFHRPWRDDGDPLSTGSTAGRGRASTVGRQRPTALLAVMAALSCLTLSLSCTVGGAASAKAGAQARLDEGSRPHPTSAMVRRSGGVHQARASRVGRAAVTVRAVHDTPRPHVFSIVSEAAATSVRRQVTAFAPNRAPPV